MTLPLFFDKVSTKQDKEVGKSTKLFSQNEEEQKVTFLSRLLGALKEDTSALKNSKNAKLPDILKVEPKKEVETKETILSELKNRISNASAKTLLKTKTKDEEQKIEPKEFESKKLSDIIKLAEQKDIKVVKIAIQKEETKDIKESKDTKDIKKDEKAETKSVKIKKDDKPKDEKIVVVDEKTKNHKTEIRTEAQNPKEVSIKELPARDKTKNEPVKEQKGETKKEPQKEIKEEPKAYTTQIQTKSIHKEVVIETPNKEIKIEKDVQKIVIKDDDGKSKIIKKETKEITIQKADDEKSVFVLKQDIEKIELDSKPKPLKIKHKNDDNVDEKESQKYKKTDEKQEIRDVKQEPKQELKDVSTESAKIVKKEIKAIEAEQKTISTNINELLRAKSEASDTQNGESKKERQKERNNESFFTQIIKEKHVEVRKVINSDEQHTPMIGDVKAQNMDLLFRSANAKESLKNFASDLKERLENYKPPVTKLTMELHPENMGPIDVTITTRGNNIIVQLTSNPIAINLFAQNQAEFKGNLQNLGFENVQMNFNFSGGLNNGGGGSESGFGRESREQRAKNIGRLYNMNEKDAEAAAASLEIVLPKYI